MGLAYFVYVLTKNSPQTDFQTVFKIAQQLDADLTPQIEKLENRIKSLEEELQNPMDEQYIGR